MVDVVYDMAGLGGFMKWCMRFYLSIFYFLNKIHPTGMFHAMNDFFRLLKFMVPRLKKK